MPHTHQISVLIIDDNPRLIEDYRSFLRESDISVFTASDGLAGLAQAKEHQPSVILLDLMLPTMNGLETLKKLKEEDTTQAIPVIIITALVEDREKEASLAAGAAAYVAKVDTEPADLIHLIKSVLHHQT